MCPSYLATREEKDSTRGRARVLQDVADGTPRRFDDPAVDEALDLCLSCKGCARDCPTGIDMATYKSEALHQKYRRQAAAPRSHYALGQLPRWAPDDRRRGWPTPMLRSTDGRPARQGGGRRRPAARACRAFAPQTAARSGRTPPSPDDQPDVWIWADSFTDHFAADTGQRRDRAAGVGRAYRAAVIPDDACCGADLDHHRPARPRPGGSCARTVATLHAVRRRRRPGRRARAVAAWPILRSDAGRAGRRPRAAEVVAGHPHARRAARPADAAAGRRRT